jgi:hypothetical protein
MPHARTVHLRAADTVRAAGTVRATNTARDVCTGTTRDSDTSARTST